MTTARDTGRDRARDIRGQPFRDQHAAFAGAPAGRGVIIPGGPIGGGSSADLSSLARETNPQAQGWINYYGAFYRSGLRFLAWRINEHLARWAMQKYKRFRGRYARAMERLQKVCQYKPTLFAHWRLIAFTASRTVGAG